MATASIVLMASPVVADEDGFSVTRLAAPRRQDISGPAIAPAYAFPCATKGK